MKSTKSEDNRAVPPGSIVDYEQHGKPYLGVVLEEKKNQFVVLNNRAQELLLARDRLFVLPQTIELKSADKKSLASQLEKFGEKAEEFRKSIDLETVWSLARDSSKELSENEIAELIFPSADGAQSLAVRRALIEDSIYFKRRKSGYESRDPQVVQELKLQAVVAAKLAEDRRKFGEQLISRIKGEKSSLERNWGIFGVSDLEQLAACGGQAENARETAEFVEELNDSAALGLTGKSQDKAFQLLVNVGHFSQDTDLNLYSSSRPILFSPAVIEEVRVLAPKVYERLSQVTESDPKISFTIDSALTRDMDDALSLEEVSGGYRIGIHISNVADAIPPGSKLEEQAYRRATSMYAPDYQIPMLPEEFSEGALSLVAGEFRSVVSFYLTTNKHYEVVSSEVRQEVIKVSNRLTYDEVDERLTTGKIDDPLNSRLIKLHDAASHFETLRIEKGALQFTRRELIPAISEKGIVTLRCYDEDTPARKLVSELMIVANSVAASFGKERSIPLVFRSQEKPDCDILTAGEDILEGPAREYFRRGLMKRSITSSKALPHYGLGLANYLQVTSPIRRSLDLVNQRQINSFLVFGRPFYSEEQVRELIGDAEARLDEAHHLQRQRTRFWLLRYLEQKNASYIEGTIVRVDKVKPLVEVQELLSILPFQPAKSVGNFAEKKFSRLGERVRLKIHKLSAREDRLQLVEE